MNCGPSMRCEARSPAKVQAMRSLVPATHRPASGRNAIARPMLAIAESARGFATGEAEIASAPLEIAKACLETRHTALEIAEAMLEMPEAGLEIAAARAEIATARLETAIATPEITAATLEIARATMETAETTWVTMRRPETSQPRAEAAEGTSGGRWAGEHTPWVAGENAPALKGRNKLCHPFRAEILLPARPRALPWAGLFAHRWCSPRSFSLVPKVSAALWGRTPAAKLRFGGGRKSAEATSSFAGRETESRRDRHSQSAALTLGMRSKNHFV